MTLSVSLSFGRYLGELGCCELRFAYARYVDDVDAAGVKVEVEVEVMGPRSGLS